MARFFDAFDGGELPAELGNAIEEELIGRSLNDQIEAIEEIRGENALRTAGESIGIRRSNSPFRDFGTFYNSRVGRKIRGNTRGTPMAIPDRDVYGSFLQGDDASLAQVLYTNQPETTVVRLPDPNIERRDRKTPRRRDPELFDVAALRDPEAAGPAYPTYLGEYVRGLGPSYTGKAYYDPQTTDPFSRAGIKSVPMEDMADPNVVDPADINVDSHLAGNQKPYYTYESPEVGRGFKPTGRKIQIDPTRVVGDQGLVSRPVGADEREEEITLERLAKMAAAEVKTPVLGIDALLRRPNFRMNPEIAANEAGFMQRVFSDTTSNPATEVPYGYLAQKNAKGEIEEVPVFLATTDRELSPEQLAAGQVRKQILGRTRHVPDGLYAAKEVDGPALVRIGSPYARDMDAWMDYMQEPLGARRVKYAPDPSVPKQVNIRRVIDSIPSGTRIFRSGAGTEEERDLTSALAQMSDSEIRSWIAENGDQAVIAVNPRAGKTVLKPMLDASGTPRGMFTNSRAFSGTTQVGPGEVIRSNKIRKEVGADRYDLFKDLTSAGRTLPSSYASRSSYTQPIAAAITKLTAEGLSVPEAAARVLSGARGGRPVEAMIGGRPNPALTDILNAYQEEQNRAATSASRPGIALDTSELVSGNEYFSDQPMSGPALNYEDEALDRILSDALDEELGYQQVIRRPDYQDGSRSDSAPYESGPDEMSYLSEVNPELAVRAPSRYQRNYDAGLSRDVYVEDAASGVDRRFAVSPGGPVNLSYEQVMEGDGRSIQGDPATAARVIRERRQQPVGGMRAVDQDRFAAALDSEVGSPAQEAALRFLAERATRLRGDNYVGTPAPGNWTEEMAVERDMREAEGIPQTRPTGLIRITGRRFR